jgi:hypothetical protein
MVIVVCENVMWMINKLRNCYSQERWKISIHFVYKYILLVDAFSLSSSSSLSRKIFCSVPLNCKLYAKIYSYNLEIGNFSAQCIESTSWDEMRYLINFKFHFYSSSSTLLLHQNIQHNVEGLNFIDVMRWESVAELKSSEDDIFNWIELKNICDTMLVNILSFSRFTCRLEFREIRYEMICRRTKNMFALLAVFCVHRTYNKLMW